MRGWRSPRCSGARGRRRLRPPDRPPAAGHTGFSPGGRRRTAGRTQQTDACSRTRSGEARLGSSSGRARLEKCPAESSPYAALISYSCAIALPISPLQEPVIRVSRSGARFLKSQKPPELSQGGYKHSGDPKNGSGSGSKNSRRPGFPGAPSRTPSPDAAPTARAARAAAASTLRAEIRMRQLRGDGTERGERPVASPSALCGAAAPRARPGPRPLPRRNRPGGSRP